MIIPYFLFLHQLMEIWVASSVWLLWIILQLACRSISFFFFNRGGKSEGEERPRVRPPLRPAPYVTTAGVVVTASCARRFCASCVPVSTPADPPCVFSHLPRALTHALNSVASAALPLSSAANPDPLRPLVHVKQIKPVRVTLALNMILITEI